MAILWYSDLTLSIVLHDMKLVGSSCTYMCLDNKRINQHNMFINELG